MNCFRLMPRVVGKAVVLPALLLPLILTAQSTLPHPILNTIYPCAAQVGTTTEVTITGTDLEGASRLHFSAKGIECKAGAKPNVFSLTISKEAPAGYCDVRVVGRYGISNPRGFAITKLPVVEMKDKALKASTGQVIMGKSLKQDQAIITFDAKKGEALQVLCKPELLDSRMESVVAIRNASGSAVARMDAEGALTFTPTADGAYAIELRDLMFRGDAEYPFALALSKHGASGLEDVPVLRPSEKLDADLSKPIAIETTYQGWFPARGKPRYFTFPAKKGEVRIIDVKSARLGLDADPFFIVEKMDGDKATFIAEANDRPALAAKDEFDAGWADPMYRFEAKEDGTYRIKLRNFYPTRVPFELSVQPPGVGFELVAIPSEVAPAAKKTAAVITSAPLWRGGVATFKVVALRERGFTGPITLSAEGLPVGVSDLGGVIAEGRDVGYISFSAEEKAEPWGGAVCIIGKNGDVAKVARGATVVRATPDITKGAIYTRLTKEVALGVVASDAPLLIEPSAPVYEVTTTGKIDVPLKLTRRAEFADAVKMTVLGLGAATPPPTVDVAAKGVAGSLKADVAKLKLTPGDYTVVLQTTAKFKLKGDDPKAKPKDVVATVHSKPFLVRVTTAPKPEPKAVATKPVPKAEPKPASAAPAPKPEAKK